jgi:hypothetical protein
VFFHALIGLVTVCVGYKNTGLVFFMSQLPRPLQIIADYWTMASGKFDSFMVELNLKYPDMQPNSGSYPFKYQFRTELRINTLNNTNTWEHLTFFLKLEKKDDQDNVLESKHIAKVTKLSEVYGYSILYDVDYFIRYKEEKREVKNISNIRDLKKALDDTMFSYAEHKDELFAPDFRFADLMDIEPWQAVSKLVDILSVHI